MTPEKLMFSLCAGEMWASSVVGDVAAGGA
jgi:hypothetical protein